MRRLLASRKLSLHLVGRFSNAETGQANRIQSASQSLVDKVSELRLLRRGPLWWECGQVTALCRGQYQLYVLEGRIYTVSTWVAAAVAKLRRRRIILWGHGWKRAESGVKRQLRLLFYRLVDGLMVYGDQARELGISYGVPAEKFQVVYNSLYCEADLPQLPTRPAQAQAAAASPGTLIYSSRLTTRHKLDLLLEALSRWPGEAPHLIVIGEGEQRLRLTQLAEQLEVSAEFLGAVYDYEQLLQLYRQADLALSIGGAGLNVIQALSMGVPVLAEADHPDSSPEIEAVIPGRTGAFFDHDDAAELRSQLLSLLSNPAVLAQMGQQGQQLIRERYTAEAHAAAIESALLQFRR